MHVIPAIDIRAGKCVRLFQGDFDQQTVYSGDPGEVAGKYHALGFRHLHLVDLDGAESGQQSNRALIKGIAAETDLTVQFGGGIRDHATVLSWLGSGIRKCVIGSLAATDPDLVRKWLRDIGGERIVLALDVRLDEQMTPWIATHGWIKTSTTSLWQCIDSYLDSGLSEILCTDISRDGAMCGPNVALYESIVSRYPGLKLQASGGVSNVEDLRALRSAGAYAAITGRALLDGSISEAEISTFLPDA